MKTHKRYKIILEDESRLERLAEHTFSPWTLGLWGGIVLLGGILLTFLIVCITPVKRLIPGFMPDSRREASEEAILRVDSLREAYNINQIYLRNLQFVMDTERRRSDSLLIVADNQQVDATALMPRSSEEASFVARMQEREKFNVSLLAKMAAEEMILFPVSDEGAVMADSEDSYRVRMIIPDGATIMAVADGVVIDEYPEKASEGNVVIVQHDNGFISRISGLGDLLVGQGDIVNGGEVISLAPRQRKKSASEIYVELWHNGIPIKPHDYIIGRKYDSLASTDSPTP